ncbi:MAG: hypothetical protein U0790_02175 [Isosphaeraceae bacterium]
MEQLTLLVLGLVAGKPYLLSGEHPDSRWAPGIRIAFLLSLVGFVLVTISHAARP